jgi:hypothetical protein
VTFSTASATDAVEKGLDLIVVPLDAVFDGRRFKVASALK